MLNNFDSSTTMFVYLNGHHLLSYYFAVADTRMSANDEKALSGKVVVRSLPHEPRR